MNLQTPVLDSDLFLLSEGEVAYALRFRRHEDQVRSIATRAALRRMLASRLRLPPDTLRFMVNRHGKPYLQDKAGIEFNVSHAGCFALIALSTNGQVGVDIEYRGCGIDAKSLGAYVFSPLERKSGLIANEDFIQHWVVKESVLKALGEGISEHLQAISILPGDEEGYRIEHDRPEWAGIKAWSIEAPDCYAAALAKKNRNSAFSAPKTLQPHQVVM
ncbi:4'-phosphopantetheinyl transferase superfamily protein [Nitrosospira sp. NpAV]|uniref:4'-phosphopantetheinyl transferase family protein n=1 Tax=Nitrosospira sp. NpAV TaxID=58133 RepID=UPI0018DCE3B2|nr:4'-phosphopantetheinyl transferase superfamily protein [Nitrosospira sp. NpAV]